MNTTLTTTMPNRAAIRPNVPPADARAVSRNRGLEDPDRASTESAAMSAVSSLGFETLLRATQAMARAAHTGYQGTASAAQVFEADPNNPRNARARGETPLEQQVRADAGKLSGSSHLDRTGVEARAKDAAAESQPSSGRASRDVWSASSSPLHAPTGDVLAGRQSRGAHEAFVSARTADRSDGQKAVAPPFGDGSPLASGAGQRAVTQSLPAVASSGATAATGAVQSVAKPTAASPAQQVAQILGAGRGGEVETLRAATPSGGGGAGRQLGGDGRATQNLAARHGGATGESEQAGRPARADDVERTPFDKLVRSIRLNRGAKHSSARIQLDPPELGRLDVDVRVSGDRIRIEVRAATAEARQLVHEQASRLTTALQKHGLEVEHLEVTVDGGNDATDGSLVDGETGAAFGRGRRAEQTGAFRRGTTVTQDDAGGQEDGNDKTDSMVVSEIRLDIRV